MVEKKARLGVVAHASNPTIQPRGGERQADHSEFEASLVHIVSSRPARGRKEELGKRGRGRRRGRGRVGEGGREGGNTGRDDWGMWVTDR